MEDTYTRYNLRVYLKDGNSFTTGFNISDKFLNQGDTVQQIVDSYYVGRPYETSDERSILITKVDII